MTQEEKQLLLKDLCARLPYGVRADGYPWITPELVCGITQDSVNLQGSWVKIENVKPYLRPMSSMTEEEQDEFLDLIIPVDGGKAVVEEDKIEKYNEFIYSHHLDICGLIPKGFALEAEEGMYKTK